MFFTIVYFNRFRIVYIASIARDSQYNQLSYFRWMKVFLLFFKLVYKTSRYYACIMLHHGRIPVWFCFVFSPFVPWDDRISPTFPINKITPWKLYLHCIFKFIFQYIKMLIILSALHGVIQIEYNIIS